RRGDWQAGVGARGALAGVVAVACRWRSIAVVSDDENVSAGAGGGLGRRAEARVGGARAVRVGERPGRLRVSSEAKPAVSSQESHLTELPARHHGQAAGTARARA